MEKYTYTDAPNNLEEAVEKILAQLTPANIEDLKHCDATDGVLWFNSRYIRNEWGLWYNNSPMAQWFAEREIYHADDMSAVICKEVWLRCQGNGGHVIIADEAKKYQEYWEKAGSDVKSEYEGRGIEILQDL